MSNVPSANGSSRPSACTAVTGGNAAANRVEPGVADRGDPLGPRVERLEEVVGRAGAERRVGDPDVDHRRLRPRAEQLEEQLQLPLTAAQRDPRGDPAQHRRSASPRLGSMTSVPSCRPKARTRSASPGGWRATPAASSSTAPSARRSGSTDRLERVQAAQRADGTIVVVATSEAGVEHVRFVARPRRRPLGVPGARSPTTRCSARRCGRIRGLRPLRTGTVAQALLRAVAGQLILAKRARQIERSDHPRGDTRARRPARSADRAPSSARFSPAAARRGSGSARAAAPR